TRGQRVTHAEIDHRAVGEGQDRPGHVVRAITGVLENAVLSARHHFHRPVALQEPAHQVDVIGEHVEHRRCVALALEDRNRLRARIEDARYAADDLAEAAAQHLLLGAQEALLVAAAVADAKLALGGPQGVEDLVGLAQREADRLFHQHRLAELQGFEDGLRVLLLGRGDDHGGDLRVADHLVVSGAVGARAGRGGERAGAGGIAIGDRQEPDGGMLGGKARAQRADAPGADDRNADIVLLHSQPPKRSRAGDRRYATCRTGTSRRWRRTRSSSTSMPSPGRSDSSTCPRAMRTGRAVTSSANPSLVRVSPQAICGSAAAMCIAAAQAMLDSPVLAETLTLSPSLSHRRPASVAPRIPPSLMAFRLAPRAALRSWWRRMSSSEGMPSSAPMATLPAAAATVAIPAMSSALTGCSGDDSPASAPPRPYCPGA